MRSRFPSSSGFVLKDTASTEIYTLSLHDALPISLDVSYSGLGVRCKQIYEKGMAAALDLQDRKSTRLNSSHPSTSYAVFCLKKKIRVKVGIAAPPQLSIRSNDR